MDVLERLAAELEKIELRLNRSKTNTSKQDIARAKLCLESAKGHLAFTMNTSRRDCSRTVARLEKSLVDLEKQRLTIVGRIAYYRDFSSQREELKAAAKQQVIAAQHRLDTLTGKVESPEAQEQRARVTLETITQHIANSPELIEKLRQIKELVK